MALNRPRPRGDRQMADRPLERHSANANQNHHERLLHTHYGGYNTKCKVANAGEDVEKRTFVHCWWECKTERAAAVENSQAAPQKLNMELPCDPAIPLFGIPTRELRTGAGAARFSVIDGDQPRCRRRVDGSAKWGRPMQWNIIQPRKE